jgi:hypothetical protein
MPQGENDRRGYGASASAQKPNLCNSTDEANGYAEARILSQALAQAEKEDPQPQVEVALGFSMTNEEP